MFKLFLQYLKLTHLVIYTCTTESHILSNNTNTFNLAQPYTYNSGLLYSANWCETVAQVIHPCCIPGTKSHHKSTQTQQIFIPAVFQQYVSAYKSIIRLNKNKRTHTQFRLD
jgi:hypothetical protein